jgi:large subunit ribosomal protein L18
MQSKKHLTLKRVRRIRSKVKGSSNRPRLCINKTNQAMYAQIINDENGKTILSTNVKGKNVVAAKKLGEQIVKLAQDKKISKIVFDRRGFRYHGAVKALADTVREGGLEI